ncbi:SafA/ExsA family spore coat assembly protein [Pseudalkalibacillus sp. JSM 102089]|uniref:SafA/ExsA family spore coat assembly protein n=1 Tax=Pseudalkalibacillus sp. JSM 102089 TaxID=3229856 RepID=UPI0035242AF0
MKIHVVQKGDTLWKIAKKYGVDFEQLKAVNSQLNNPNMIMPGMKVKIPSGGVPVKKKEMPIKEMKKEMPKKKEKPMMKPKEKPSMTMPINNELNMNMNMNMNMMPQEEKPKKVKPKEIKPEKKMKPVEKKAEKKVEEKKTAAKKPVEKAKKTENLFYPMNDEEVLSEFESSSMEMPPPPMNQGYPNNVAGATNYANKEYNGGYPGYPTSVGGAHMGFPNNQNIAGVYDGYGNKSNQNGSPGEVAGMYQGYGNKGGYPGSVAGAEMNNYGHKEEENSEVAGAYEGYGQPNFGAPSGNVAGAYNQGNGYPNQNVVDAYQYANKSSVGGANKSNYGMGEESSDVAGASYGHKANQQMSGYPGSVGGMQYDGNQGYPNQNVAGAYEGYGHKGNNGGYPGSVGGMQYDGNQGYPNQNVAGAYEGYGHKGNNGGYPGSVGGMQYDGNEGYPNQNVAGTYEGYGHKGNNGGYPGSVGGMQYDGNQGYPNQNVAGAYEGYGHKGNNGGYPGAVAGAASGYPQMNMGYPNVAGASMNGNGMPSPYGHKGNEEYPEAVMGAYGYPNENVAGMMMPPGYPNQPMVSPYQQHDCGCGGNQNASPYHQMPQYANPGFVQGANKAPMMDDYMGMESSYAESR